MYDMDKETYYRFDGERCSNCHAGILVDNHGNKKCTNNYTYCDYSVNKPLINDIKKECIHMVMRHLDFNKSNEGKLLLASIAILTTSKFMYMGKEIDGTKLTPDEIINKLKE